MEDMNRVASEVAAEVNAHPAPQVEAENGVAYCCTSVSLRQRDQRPN